MMIITKLFYKKACCLLLALSMIACSGGNSSSAPSPATSYLSNVACFNGVRLISVVSQAAADNLVPNGCPVLNATQVGTITFDTTLSGVGVEAAAVTNLNGLPSGTVVKSSKFSVTDSKDNSYLLEVVPNPFTVVASPKLPFSESFTISAGELNFTNTPSVSLVGKKFTTALAPQAPVSNILLSSAPYYVGVGVALNAGNSTDADGTIVAYEWTFGDGTTGSGQTANHAYSLIGNYTIGLTVTDNSGMQHSSTSNINVIATPLNPVAVITPSAAPYYLGASVGFSGASSYDPDGSIVSYVWSFGDGATSTSSSATTSHVYSSTSAYQVSLTVVDNSGRTNRVNTSITISRVPVPPVAVITLSPSPFFSGTPVGFSGIASTDSDGSLSSYEWNFGDGQTSSASNIAHTYLASGQYTVKLKVVDNDGLSNIATVIINVMAATVPLPDTGVTSSQCFAAGSDALVSCSSPAALSLNSKQDGMIGRDVTNPTNTDGRLGFSFSRIASFPVTDCLKDNVTGLVWEGKPTSGNRSFENLYTNFDNPNAFQGYDFGTNSLYRPSVQQINSITNSIGYSNYVNSIALCGYTDWRLPSLSELLSIADFGVPYVPYTSVGVDLNWFPNVTYPGGGRQFAEVWSSNGSINESRFGCFYDLSSNFTGCYDRGFWAFVRLVR